MLHWRFDRRDVQRDLIPSPFNKAKSHNREEIKTSPLFFIEWRFKTFNESPLASP